MNELGREELKELTKEELSVYIKNLTKKLQHYQESVPDYSMDEKGFYLVQGISLGIQISISYLEEVSSKNS
ncbi:TPA: hypothetical protein ACGOYS_000307 [Streptococcus suis]